MPISRKNRILGGLLGLHAGDSLGATVEFTSWAHLRTTHPHGPCEITGGGPFNWAPGAATDDTNLTMAVLRAYISEARRSKQAPVERVEREKERAKIIAREAGWEMIRWLRGPWGDREEGVPPPDVGTATRLGLEKFARNNGDPEKAGAGPGARGNGSLMRCIPTGLFVTERVQRIWDSWVISGVTHDDVICRVACVVYNEMVATLVEGKSAEEAVGEGYRVARELEEREGLEGRFISAGILLAQEIHLETFIETDPKRHPMFPGAASGYVLESLWLGIAAVVDRRGFEEVLVDVMRVGRDTDTNGAVAGGLLGVREGAGGIPDRWRGVLEFGGEIEEVVERFVGKGE